jgi:hypothetical protein
LRKSAGGDLLREKDNSTLSVVPTPLTFFEMGEELFLSDAAEF